MTCNQTLYATGEPCGRSNNLIDGFSNTTGAPIARCKRHAKSGYGFSAERPAVVGGSAADLFTPEELDRVVILTDPDPDPRICDAFGDGREHAFNYGSTFESGFDARCAYCDIRPSTVNRLYAEWQARQASPILCVNVWQADDGKFGMTCYDESGMNISLVPAEFDTFEQAVADVEAFRQIAFAR